MRIPNSKNASPFISNFDNSLNRKIITQRAAVVRLREQQCVYVCEECQEWRSNNKEKVIFTALCSCMWLVSNGEMIVDAPVPRSLNPGLLYDRSTGHCWLEEMRRAVCTMNEPLLSHSKGLGRS